MTNEMTDATTRTTRPAEARAATPPTRAKRRRAGFSVAVAGEWTKVRTVRSTVWTLVVMALAPPAFAVFVAATRSLQPDVAILGGRLTGAVTAQIAAAVFGVLVMAASTAPACSARPSPPAPGGPPCSRPSPP
ncbi:MAG: hypothetical protein ACRD0A_08835 [Acidimicrobiales bacterium]